MNPLPMSHVEQSEEGSRVEVSGGKPERQLFAHIEIGAERLQVVLAARGLRADGKSWREVARALGQSPATVSRFCARVKDIADPTAADLLPDFCKSGRPRKYLHTTDDTAALRQNYLITNRTELSGSSQEAARMALRKAELSPALAATIAGRAEQCSALLPESLRREITAPPAVVKQFRNPKEAALDYFSAPGSMMWIREGARERFIRAGDILEGDDATINFIACIPWEIGGCDCSDRHGVKIGRFQWLVSIDAASRFIPGDSYTARPRSSYRGEDITSLLHAVFSLHGLWRKARFERGVFESNLVTNSLKLVGVDLLTVWSPHQKPFIEGLFSQCWTKLSDVPGQVGRFRGEEEEANKILASCKTGATDPRKYFPMLAQVLDALARVISEHNAQRVTSKNYGSWIPKERWEQQRAEHPMRPLDADASWMFSPCAKRWTVRGNLVGGAVRIMDGFSVQYEFSADWLPEYDGCLVKCHFDPAHPHSHATIVLDQPVRDQIAGEILGIAVQVNKVARYARRVLRWGDDPDMGLDARQRAACALRREVRAFAPDGRPVVKITEGRDGLGNSFKVQGMEGSGPNSNPETAPRLKPSTSIRPARNPILAAPSPDEWRRRREQLKQQASLARNLSEQEVPQ